MALDREVTWQKLRPTKKELATVLEDYAGAAGKVEWKVDRLYCTLPGSQSSPFRRILPCTQEIVRDDERWFEVFIGKDGNGIDILTRSADEFTNVVAKGFAELVARI